MLVQARIASRNGIGLDTVLRRYFAGYALLGDFIIEETENHRFLGGEELKRLLRAQASIFDRLLAEVSEEHGRESETRPGPAEERRTELVERLLHGEPIDAQELGYDLEATHTALVATGPGATEVVRELAVRLDRRLLLVQPDEQTAWAWLGGRRAVDPQELERLATGALPPQAVLALGESGEGIAGWRLTHRQARAALPIAQHRPTAFARYGDVALLASIVNDDMLVTSLRELYLVPLEDERDGGRAARETLRAYFTTGRNVSSAAAALKVSRQTVTSRLRAIEEKLGRAIEDCATEIEVAMHLHSLTSHSMSPLSH